jgi:hypothetical protein
LSASCHIHGDASPRQQDATPPAHATRRATSLESPRDSDTPTTVESTGQLDTPGRHHATEPSAERLRKVPVFSRPHPPLGLQMAWLTRTSLCTSRHIQACSQRPSLSTRAMPSRDAPFPRRISTDKWMPNERSVAPASQLHVCGIMAMVRERNARKAKAVFQRRSKRSAQTRATTWSAALYGSLML